MRHLIGKFPRRFGKAPSPGERYFEFRDAETGNAVEVAVHYAEGGMSYFTYKNEGRGAYVHVTPVEISEGVVSRMLLGSTEQSGFKMFVLPMDRRNAKKLEAVAEKVDAIVPEIAKMFREGKYQDIAAKVREIFPQPTVAV